MSCRDQQYPALIPDKPDDRASLFESGHWRAQFLAATVEMDLRRSRAVVNEAADAGASLSTLYVDVVRPGLVRALQTPQNPTEARLLVESAMAALSEVASRPLDGAHMHGAGRCALVSVGGAPLDELDGQVIVDALAADGWTVEEVEATAPAEVVAATADARGVQLVVMPTANPADLLLVAAAYTLLHRLPEPPAIVACSFGRPGETSRARAAGADAFADTPGRLLAYVEERFHGVRATSRRFRQRALDTAADASA